MEHIQQTAVTIRCMERRVARAVVAGEVEKDFDRGTGLGISLAANKVKGIRACVCSEPFTAKMSRAHNDCNILAFGARVVGGELAKMIVDTWIDTEFEGGRHQRRVDAADGDRGEKLNDFKKETALHFIRARKSLKKGKKMQ